MKNNYNDIEKLFMSEEVTLPESLSAEKIEELLNENGKIVNPKRINRGKGAKITKTVVSLAASLILVVGLGITADRTKNYFDMNKQELIINNQIADSDYSQIENVVLSYYREIFNNQNNDDYLIFEDIIDGGIKNESAMDMAPEGSAPGQNTSISGTAGGGISYGETNTQVEGVDEADLIKNDGSYIYYLNNNKIIISDCRDAENMNIVSEIVLFEDSQFFDIFGSEMYLYDDKLVVVINESSDYEQVSDPSNGALCDCVCYALKTDTIIKVFDVADKTKPVLSYTQKITGNSVSSRMINDKLITVSQFSIPYYQLSGDDFEDACYMLKSLCIPEYSVNDGELKKIPSDRIKMFDEESPTVYTVTSIVNLSELSSEPMVNAFLGGAEDIYCTKEEIFVAETLYTTWSQTEELVVSDELGNKFDIATKVHKMDIADDGVKYVSAVTVGGMCINQFSMDKNGDYFRIATNGWSYNGSNQKTMVYVIDKDMKIVGFLDDIAPGEQMKSARFLGNMLYLVTFMQTDPLFTVDLSDPANPELKGELKIPGFSSYLHPIGNGLVIGIGEGGTDTGLNGKGKISLFDVSDPASPKELDNYTTNYAGTLNSNHKAFLIIDENTFAVPFYCYGVAEYIIVFSTENNGIIIDNTYDCLKGSLDYNAARGTFIDSVFFAVNNNGIVSYDMATAEKFGELKF